MPEAKFRPTEPLGQLVGLTDSQRLKEHARLLLPRAIVARLRFSDLYPTNAPNRVKPFHENWMRKGLTRHLLRRWFRKDRAQDKSDDDESDKRDEN